MPDECLSITVSLRCSDSMQFIKKLADTQTSYEFVADGGYTDGHRTFQLWIDGADSGHRLQLLAGGTWHIDTKVKI